MRHMAKEASGLWQCELIRPDSPHRPQTTLATLAWFRALRRAETEPPQCLCCDAEFQWPDAIPAAMIFLAPERGDPSIASVTGICGGCSAQTDAELQGAALAFFRSSFLPDARRLDAAHFSLEAGSA
jgi:hypothetical protein